MTVQEVLKQTGLTDDEIKALDPKIVTGLTQVVTSAEQLLSQAELKDRSQRDTYDKEIAPALVNWANEKASLETKMAALEAALKSAKEGGFTVPDILTTPAAAAGTRGPDGKFVAGANEVPGSPKLVETIRGEVGAAFSFAADTQWKYRSLFGAEIPDSPTDLIREATAQRMSPSEWAAKKYDFSGKEKAKKEAEQKAHDDAIRKEAADAKDKEWAEKVGSNPMMRQASESRFAEVAKATQKGERKDTMTMTPEQRRQYTREQIHKEIATNQTVN